MKETLRHLPALSPDTHGPSPVQGVKNTSPALLALFVVGSFLAHGGAYAALSALPAESLTLAVSDEVSFEVFEAPPEKAPEPVEAPAAPLPIIAPKRVVKPTEKPASVAKVQPEAAPALQQTLGVSEEKGLAVAGVVGAPTPIAGTSVTGSPEGVLGGTGPTNVAPAVSRIDLQGIARKWQGEVQAVIDARARRDYPRSAMRARLEGLVLLSIRIDTLGHVAEVQLKKSSGHPQLDEAALASARELELPAPPSALHSYLRPVTFPLNYRLQ